MRITRISALSIVGVSLMLLLGLAACSRTNETDNDVKQDDQHDEATTTSESPSNVLPEDADEFGSDDPAIDADPTVDNSISDNATIGKNGEADGTVDEADDTDEADDGQNLFGGNVDGQAPITEVPCPGTLTQTGVEGVTCALATVPLDRDDPALGTIDISIVVWDGIEDHQEMDDLATNGIPGADAYQDEAQALTPLVVLQGGPGGVSSELIGSYPRKPYRQIFIDQRGTGFGSESFDCFEVKDVVSDILAARSSEALRIELDAYEQCADRLLANPALVHTNTSNHAADVIDVMTSLGYSQWCVYGVSYGTTIALEIVRSSPEGLRCIVLDGVYPPTLDYNVDSAFSVGRSFGKFHQACVESITCSVLAPDFQSMLQELVNDTNAEPILVSLEAGDTSRNEPFEVLLDGDSLANLLFLGMYNHNVGAQLILLMAALSDDAEDNDLTESDKQFIEWALAAYVVEFSFSLEESINEGTYFATTCADRLPFTSALPEDLAFFTEIVLGEGLSKACEPWDVPASPAVAASPVISDIPVLMLSGGLDPIAPPEFAQRVAQHLSNAVLVEFVGLSHGIWPSSGCASSIVTEFLQQPNKTPDVACVSESSPELWGLDVFG